MRNEQLAWVRSPLPSPLRKNRTRGPLLRGAWVLSETQKGLKRVTLICLLCPMLVIIHFRKYHIWNEKKR